jgi:hypothetical protein
MAASIETPSSKKAPRWIKPCQVCVLAEVWGSVLKAKSIDATLATLKQAGPAHGVLPSAATPRRSPAAKTVSMTPKRTKFRTCNPPLLGVVSRLVPEGPERVPHVAVGVGQEERREVVGDEQLGAVGGPEEQQHVEDPQVHEHVGGANERELGVLDAGLLARLLHRSVTIPAAWSPVGVIAH